VPVSASVGKLYLNKLGGEERYVVTRGAMLLDRNSFMSRRNLKTQD
jgi:hypothetical protein